MQIAEDQRSEDTTALGPEYETWKSMYGQTPDNHSLYVLLQSLHDIAMVDV